ncbi:MAG TPA: DUF1552 domain-containing protein [Planctomycetota bacterium]|nr:DUF1552 domain-containing protein [Planctomycetota bacterium]
MAEPMSRRTLLKGLGVTLALPFLDAMLSRSALAGEADKYPRRFLTVGTEGGIWTGEDGFFPYAQGLDVERAKNWGRKGILPGGHVADTGPNFKLTSTLEPLAEHRKDILLLSGLHHKNDAVPSPAFNAHGQDLGTLLTGCNVSGTPGVSVKNSISLDQYIAEKIGHHTRVPSLALTVGDSSYNTKEATALGYMGFLSYDADGYALPTEGEAAQLFDRLFTDGSPRQSGERERQRQQQKSILDSVLSDIKRLNQRVAAPDRVKLDEYFTNIRELENRIERAKKWEKVPINLPPGTKRPPEAKRKGGVYLGDGSPRVEQMRQMIDTLVLTLQTDVTRIATLRLGGYYGKFSFLGFPEEAHAVYAHNGGAPAKVAGAKAIDRLHVEQFAYLISRMKSIKEGGKTLFDNSILLYAGGLTNGPAPKVHGTNIAFDAHGQFNTPVMLAGGGGRLKTGQHLNFDHGTPLANLFVNILEGMGLPDEQFVDSKGPLPGLA